MNQVKILFLQSSGNWQVGWMDNELTNLPKVRSKLLKTGESQKVHP